MTIILASVRAWLQRILEVLARHQAQCVVIGGYAGRPRRHRHRYRRHRHHPAADQANLGRLASALAEVHAAIRGRASGPSVPLPAARRLLARAEVLNLTTAGDLDIGMSLGSRR
jgi:hypothetical protein